MSSAPVGLPTGTVTLLLGDMELSVRAWEDRESEMLGVARRLVEVVSDVAIRHRGARPVEQGEGDSFVLAFARAQDAVACALELQLAILNEPWHGGIGVAVRMGLHTGDIDLRDEGNYAGPTINRCARLRALGHGGQVLVSQTTAVIVDGHLPPGATLRDLGEHRLRDLARPERLLQLCHPGLVDGLPPLASPASRPHNLPAHLTEVIGREEETAAVLRLLERQRLVTLTGAGGCGKTRLAVEVAAESLDDHGDGVWWIDLAPLSDPSLVVAVVATAISVQQSQLDTSAEGLARAIGDRSMLIVLDNCEHLVGACAILAEALLGRCRGLGLLATSREALAVDGEATYRVPSLPVPASDDKVHNIAKAPAVRLFVERATSARADFSLAGEEGAVGEICRRLDGIPLAIELAASRVRMMSPAQIAAALSDRFRLLTGGVRNALPRQRTLEASVDWSYTLLTDEERAVLGRMSVFAGSFDLAAAEGVCAGDGIDRACILDVVGGLVDRSLVQVEERSGGARYRLLETIRAYMRQRLVEHDDADAVRHRHLDHYVDAARGVADHVSGEALLVALAGFDADLDNLRAASDWAMASDRHDDSLRIAALPIGLWIARGLFVETAERVEAALPTCADPRLRAKAHLTLSTARLMGGDDRAALLHARPAVEGAREVGDEATLVRALGWLAWTEHHNGIGIGTVRAHVVEAERLARSTGNQYGLLRALYDRGSFETWHVGPSAGISYFDEALALATDLQTIEAVYCHLFMAEPYCLAGDYAQARNHAQTSLGLARTFGVPAFESFSLSVLGSIATRTGDLPAARAHLDESLEIATRHGLAVFEFAARFYSGDLDYAAGDLKRARERLTKAWSAVTQIGAVSGSVRVSWRLALVALALGDLAGAKAACTHAREHQDHYRLPQPFGRSVTVEARIARVEADPGRAETLALEALDVLASAGIWPGVVEALETLSGALADLHAFDAAARLFGAADRLRRELGHVRYPVEQPAYDADLATVRQGLGDAFDRAWTEGLALSAEDAVAYARRGRGERKRPIIGWASLTPTELDVVRLVAEGRTNPEIAERLFMSRNTVKTHLSHVFTKLGVATRSELAAEATRRDARPAS